jgi:hypothetical protein
MTGFVLLPAMPKRPVTNRDLAFLLKSISTLLPGCGLNALAHFFYAVYIRRAVVSP